MIVELTVVMDARNIEIDTLQRKIASISPGESMLIYFWYDTPSIINEDTIRLIAKKMGKTVLLKCYPDEKTIEVLMTNPIPRVKTLQKVLVLDSTQTKDLSPITLALRSLRKGDCLLVTFFRGEPDEYLVERINKLLFGCRYEFVIGLEDSQIGIRLV